MADTTRAHARARLLVTIQRERERETHTVTHLQSPTHTHTQTRTTGRADYKFFVRFLFLLKFRVTCSSYPVWKGKIKKCYNKHFDVMIVTRERKYCVNSQKKDTRWREDEIVSGNLISEQSDSASQTKRGPMWHGTRLLEGRKAPRWRSCLL